MDVPSLLLSSIGFGSLLFSISANSTNSFLSSEILFFFIIGIISLIAFVYRDLKIKNPLLQLNLFKYPIFSITVILSSVSYMALLGFESILPDFIQKAQNISPLNSGLMLLPGALIMGIMSPIAGKLFDKFGGKYLISIGLLLLSIGTFPFIFVEYNTPSIYITIFYAVRLFGIALALMPTITTGMNAIPLKDSSNGSAINNTLRQMASSFGTSVLVFFISATTQRKISVHLEIKDLSIPEAVSMQTAGYHSAFIVTFVFCLLAFFISLFFSFSKTTRVKKNNKI